MFPHLTRRRIVAFGASVVVAGLVATGLVVLVHRHDDLPSDAAFRIGGTVVTATQVDERMKSLQALYGIAKPVGAAKIDSFRRDSAKSVAVEKLLGEQARKHGIVISDKAASDALTALIQQRYPDGGRQAFIQALGTMGASEAQVIAEIKEQMLIARLFDLVTDKISVSSTAVDAAFTKRRASLGTPERRQIRNIVVSTLPAARQLLKKLQRGSAFGPLAKKFSLDEATRMKGGVLGTLASAQLETGYAAAAFAASPGQPFGPVRTKSGWNVGVVEKVVPAVVATLAGVSTSLKEELLGEQSVKAWRSWLGTVIKNAHIVYAKRFQPAKPDEVPAMTGQESVTGQ
ncbi:MAG: PpiC-type peptidyl-prolyl cis-trans isomerase [Marmoricola sp.]|nr:PpiC-type peptidyl-prolyl cis-trans isomerase [Marmoricola sp.]